MSIIHYECLNDVFCTLWMSERCLFVRFWCTQILEIDRGSIDLDFSTSFVCYEILKSLKIFDYARLLYVMNLHKFFK